MNANGKPFDLGKRTFLFARRILEICEAIGSLLSGKETHADGPPLGFGIWGLGFSALRDSGLPSTVESVFRVGLEARVRYTRTGLRS